MQAARIATGGKNVHTVPREYGRFGYDVPVAQLTIYRLKPRHSAGVDDDDIVADEANISTEDGLFRCQADASSAWQDAHLDEVHIYAEGNMSRSQADASCGVDDPGGSVDDPGGGNTNDLGSYSYLATFTTTSPNRLSPLL